MDIKFLEFIATPGERHLGIVVIKWNGLILRYKISQGAHGKGYFPNIASYKVGLNPITGKDKYECAFDIDSKYENEKILDFVKSHAYAHLNKTSVFGMAPGIANQIMAQTPSISSNPYHSPTELQGELPF